MDFSKFSDSELLESLNTLDADKYPDTQARLLAEIKRRGHKPESLLAHVADEIIREEIKADEAQGVTRGYRDEEGRYVPNKVSSATRRQGLIIILFLTAYGLISFSRDVLVIPGRRSSSPDILLRGDALILGLTAFALFALYLLSFIVDHYDRRDNEDSYRTFREFTLWTGGIVMLIATFLRD